MGAQARDIAVRYSWSAYADHWSELLKSIAKSVSPSRAPKARVLLLHPGTQHSFRLAGELHRRGVLSRFSTGYAWFSPSLIEPLWQTLPRFLQRRLASRRLVGVAKEKV